MYLIILFISAVRTVSRGHKLVADGWALFEKTCSEVGAGELPQLLRYVKQATTPTPPPLVHQHHQHQQKWNRRRIWRSKPAHLSRSLSRRSLSMSQRGGGKLFITSAPTATSPPRSPNGVWIPISVLSTQRRLSCAPSVPSALTTWIRSRGMRRSTSRAFFGVDLG